MFDKLNLQTAFFRPKTLRGDRPAYQNRRKKIHKVVVRDSPAYPFLSSAADNKYRCTAVAVGLLHKFQTCRMGEFHNFLISSSYVIGNLGKHIFEKKKRTENPSFASNLTVLPDVSLTQHFLYWLLKKRVRLLPRQRSIDGKLIFSPNFYMGHSTSSVQKTIFISVHSFRQKLVHVFEENAWNFSGKSVTVLCHYPVVMKALRFRLFPLLPEIVINSNGTPFFFFFYTMQICVNPRKKRRSWFSYDTL